MSQNGTAGLAELPDPDYKYITTTEEAYRHLEFIERHPTIEVDTETTGLDPLTEKVVLVQLGVNGKAFVFDVRKGNVDGSMFKHLLESKKHLKILQNAVFDYEMLKTNFGIEMNRIYDTMLAEQLLYLGLHQKSNLQYLIAKYLHINMPKDIGRTFQDYNQEYQEYQIRYAANDVVALTDIYNLQLMKLKEDGLMRVAQLEFDFIRPMAEMELNGMLLDVPQWRGILEEKVVERDKLRIELSDAFNRTMDQTTMFGVSLLNLDSPKQVLKCLHDLGVDVETSDVKELKKHKSNPIVKLLLDYRKVEKFITTYGEPMIDRIHPLTGRLHTRFKQMVDTGRMSSSDPNLQNIPKKQKYRSCFVSRPGYKLLTCDMSAAELRIIANLSRDPLWVKIFNEGGDLHVVSAAGVFGISEEEVIRDNDLKDENPDKKGYRGKSKPISFGLAYGLSEHGLSIALGISKDEAKQMIDNYFKQYPVVHRYLEKSGKFAVRNQYATSISGRRRYFRLPSPDDPNFNKARGAIERQGKNTPIQGCLVSGTNIKGAGRIEEYVDKVINIETGLGENKALGVYSGNKEVYRLKLSNGIKLGITLDHKIPVCTNLGMIDKKVSEIDFNDDMLIIPLNVVDGAASNLSGYKYEKGHWRETYVEYPYPDFMDEKLAFIIGCLIGDGNYSKHNYISFVCRKSQQELFYKFNNYVKNVFNYDVVINESQKKAGILLHSQASSVVIRGFLKHVGLDYVINRKKAIPKCFFTETLKNKSALLDGLFSTDGGVTKESGPNYTTVSEQLAIDVHQLLFSIGINSNLKEYDNEYGKVYRIQVPKRFINKFLTYVGSSVNVKREKLFKEFYKFSGKDHSLVPKFISDIIYASLYKSVSYDKLTYNEKAHLRRLKLGSCSFSAWRKFYGYMDEGPEKEYLSKFLDYDFCKPVSIEKMGCRDVYDLICKDDPRYFIANGTIVHNSNADTIKQSMVHVVERIKGYDARLLLTVHDEIIVEARDDQAMEVKPIVEQAIRDGFDDFFTLVRMEAEADVEDYWVKD